MFVLSAPLTISFDYTRSLGPVLGRFMTALRERRVLGSRTADGRVHVPPLEYDPATHAPVIDLVEVRPTGTVTSWTWTDRPLDGQPLDRPFAWALIRLDGADTALLHAVDAGSRELMRTGMRVSIRWAADRTGHIRDIACFQPGEVTDGPDRRDDEPVTVMTTPIRLSYTHTTSADESRYLYALADGRLLGQRCPVCRKVYVPPRVCPADGVPTEEEVAIRDHGTVTTFCVVNVPFAGQRLDPPYVVAQILLDGADIPIPHLILGLPADQVRMGMRVAAVWRDPESWTTTPENIVHFRPTGEPDAPYESYREHL
ncbi:DNA-binding protein [Actinoplanes ianthinogenes]|uniref:DNA-binding protein n=1 Tax=Actinoplanes ianthinogenes TaxID=122358 RepID=A0ABM7LPK0_9ACTN|nr:OB-fold nucleic acid binding domain-containing protein [Actinoplanes ianthinogenes]BCJ41209.1 DNA-binding protein [Actinoplanes ianthinogenes]GGR22185.1 DNA-binding protein [Actinoplanes ianthinogenes]